MMEIIAVKQPHADQPLPPDLSQHVRRVISTRSRCSRHSYKSFDTRISHDISTRSALTLGNARREGQLRLLRLRGPTLSIGCISALVGAVLVLKTYYGTGNEDDHLLRVFGGCLAYLSFITLLMSLLPFDDRAVPIALLVSFIVTSFACYAEGRSFATSPLIQSSSCRFAFEDAHSPCGLIHVYVLSRGLGVLTRIGMTLYCMWLFTIMRQQEGAAWILRGLCKMLRIFSFSNGLSDCSVSIACMAAGRHPMATSYGVLGIVGIVIGCLSGRAVVTRTQSWLLSRGGAAMAAAGIAQLLGGQHHEVILDLARNSFFCVKAEKLLFEDMRENKPSPDLAALTEHAHLGHVDAFVSHSWHDDPELKWKALQNWREDFKRCHGGKEPRLWIDKYCIDQNNIKDSLACLPVYLAGCRRFVIFCGSTYLTRLWCLIEIFVFLQMGGALENLDVILLEHTRPGDFDLSGDPVDSTARSSNLSMTSLETELHKFDCRAARCFTEEDTRHLQRVIDVVGSRQIDELVREVFLNKLQAQRTASCDGDLERPRRRFFSF